MTLAMMIEGSSRSGGSSSIQPRGQGPSLITWHLILLSRPPVVAARAIRKIAVADDTPHSALRVFPSHHHHGQLSVNYPYQVATKDSGPYGAIPQ